MNKLLLSIFLGLILLGCNSAESPGIEQMLELELTKVDWTKVDTYPSITACDSILDPLQKKECFYGFMANELQGRMSQDTLKGNFIDVDTIKVLVTITHSSEVIFKLVPLEDSLKNQNYILDSLLQSKAKNFPNVYPATKQGVTVNSEFILPIVLIRQ